MVDRNQVNTNYDESNIDYLEGVEHVRKRPGMYMGGTDVKALHHMVYEVVDNSVDEALAGRCDAISITLHADNAVTVSDNGAGIPVAIHPRFGVSALELVMTKIGAGGKFDNNAYKVSGGLHGVGVSAVNALSEHVRVQVRREGHLHQQEYQRGHAITPVEKIRPLEAGEPTGTATTFLPDPTIMEELEFSYQTLLQRFREMAFLASGVTLTLRDERVQPFPKEMTFYFEGGVRSFVYYLNRNRDALHPIVYGTRDVMINEDNPEKAYAIGVEFAFQYTDSSTTTELAFANTINTPDGGQHQSGMRTAITRTINNYARKAGLLKEKEANFSGNDTLEGLTAIISIKHPDPQFESQTKVKLMNAEVNGAVSSVVGDIFNEFLETNSREGRRIVEKCMTSMRARDAAKKASELVRRGSSLLENTTLPGKLADCSNRDPKSTELYIVEGDSAGGSAKQGRDRHFQAILPLRGKILNTERARLNKILDNNEVRALISALGVGIHPDFDISKLRYDRIIIMSVASDEPTLVMNEHGETEFVRIGDFIDDCEEGRRDYRRYKVMSFDLDNHITRFSPLKKVIRHGHEESMYHITTRYNRSVKVTSSHSVFVYENGKVVLKKGNEIKAGDILVASRRLPRPTQHPTHIDLLTTLYDAGQTQALYVQGADVQNVARQRLLAKVARPELWNEPYVEMGAGGWQNLIAYRQEKGLSQKQAAHAIGVKQPITISHWERGLHRPILPQFMAYVQALGYEGELEYTLAPSTLDERLNGQENSKNARWRVVSDYKLLSQFTPEEIAVLGNEVKLSPKAHTEKAFDRYLPITRELVWLLGWFVAEGTLSAHQVSINLGEKDEAFIPEICAAVEKAFGETPRCYHDPNSKGIKLYFHSVAAARLFKAWGIAKHAHEKRLPDFIFSLSEDLQSAFLEGYFLGDGMLSNQGFSLTTNSPALKDGLLYLLGQLGIVASHTHHQPSTLPDAPIQTRHSYYTIAISDKSQVAQWRTIWQRHANASRLEAYLATPNSKSLAFVPISDDLMGLEVISAEEIDPVGEYVYDFSVERDENFICGTGGLCAHNTDADVDGAHIRTLLLTFFFRYMQPLISEGHLYIAQPPIYRLAQGKDVRYYYSQAGENDAQTLARGLKDFKNPDKVHVQRYKGLGEMNPDQLWDTTMNPEVRSLLRVTVEDASEADKTFDMLMGNAVPPRRRFIQTHARTVRNLDI